jgi:hypothetical protein
MQHSFKVYINLKQVNTFNYLENMISYEKELDIDNKLHDYLKITGILNNLFRPQKNPLRKKNKIIQITSPTCIVW